MSTAKRRQTPATIVVFILLLTFGFGLIARIVFLGLIHEHLGIGQIIFSLSRGWIFDGVVALYLSLPFVFMGLLFPLRWSQNRFWQSVLSGGLVLVLALLSLSTLSEAFFVDEFKSRFNFIAVDYLVYTNEVLKNIWESYPLGWILPLYMVLVYLGVKLIFRFTPSSVNRFFNRPVWAMVFVITLGAHFFVNENRFFDGKDPLNSEISKNTLYTLFTAYNTNEINFKRFYTNIDSDRAAHLVHEALEEDIPGLSENEKDEEEDETSIVRNIQKVGPARRLNVVIVLMESMSARFMKRYGGGKEITPHLDQLANEGLTFDRAYSTGTRTVRGIEAVLLSIPPTPGQSIVRRPEGKGLFNLGSVLRENGYQTQFIYGGHAFFDNMGPFFSNNGFEVLDQSEIPKEKTHFSNAWGVCDEDLFDFSLVQADRVANTKGAFFQFILTSSNHRPYSFPEGRIDLPSIKGGRDGAVKYADFSIGRYMAEAKTKPWFKDTIFIFVADHNASVAGGTTVIPSDYHIPIIFYSPGHLPPKVQNILASQIDLAPTLLGILNISYQSRFFGHDLQEVKAERAFLGTYQRVGLWKNDKLVLLSPNRRVEVFNVKNDLVKLDTSFTAIPDQKFEIDEIEQTVSYYEVASDWFRDSRLKETDRSDATKNKRIF